MLSKEVCQACFRINNKVWRKKNERQWDEKGIVVCPNPVSFAKEIMNEKFNPPKYVHDDRNPFWYTKTNNNKGVKQPIDEVPEWCPYETEHMVCRDVENKEEES